MPTPVPLTYLPFFIDGDFSTPQEISRKPREYPFEQYGDVTSYVYEVTYVQDLASYTPTAPFTVDPLNTSAKLLRETKPVLKVDPGQGHLCTFRRFYGSAFADQVTYGFPKITKPDPAALATAGQFFSDATGGSSDAGGAAVAAYLYSTAFFALNKFYSQKASTSTLTLPTGSTFTLTYKTDTTAALAYNAVNATINAALNGLASVIADGLTFSAITSLAAGGRLDLNLTVGSTASRVTMNAAALTPAGANIAFTFIVSAVLQVCSIAARVSCVAHGFSNLLPLLVKGPVGGATINYLLPYSLQWSIVDADTVAVSIGFFNNGTNLTEVGQFVRNYTPGTFPVRARLTMKFTDAPAGVAVPSAKLNDAAFLDAVLANLAAFVVYDSTDMDFWNGTARKAYTVTELDFGTV